MTCYIDQTGLEPTELCLPLPPECLELKTRALQWVWRFNEKCLSWAYDFEHLAPQLVALFWEVIKHLGGGALLEAIHPWTSCVWTKTWSASFLIQLPCLPCCDRLSPSGAMSQNKPSLSYVAFVIVFSHSNRKVTSTQTNAIVQSPSSHFN